MSLILKVQLPGELGHHGDALLTLLDTLGELEELIYQYAQEKLQSHFSQLSLDWGRLGLTK